VRDLAAHEHGMQHSGQAEVGDELPRSGQQAAILAPHQGASDKPR
jgi:hypothetical protein